MISKRYSSLVVRAGVLCCLISTNSNANGHAWAEQAVKSLPCKGAETIDDILDHKHRNLYVDLGWRVFAEESGDYLVERNFLISKSAELRYRWRVNSALEAVAVSERAQQLC